MWTWKLSKLSPRTLLLNLEPSHKGGNNNDEDLARSIQDSLNMNPYMPYNPYAPSQAQPRAYRSTICNTSSNALPPIRWNGSLSSVLQSMWRLQAWDRTWALLELYGDVLAPSVLPLQRLWPRHPWDQGNHLKFSFFKEVCFSVIRKWPCPFVASCPTVHFGRCRSISQTVLQGAASPKMWRLPAICKAFFETSDWTRKSQHRHTSITI
jgi:hypothetical protein